MNIYRAVLPNAFGYGIEAIAETHEEAMFLLEQEFLEWWESYGYNPFFTNFVEAFDYFGGNCQAITIPFRGTQGEYYG
jgi:hypothetical protein